MGLIAYQFLNKDTGEGESGNTNIFKNFFPFGGNDNNQNNQTGTEEEETPTEEIPATNDFTQKIRNLSSEPIAGAGILDVKAGSVVRYIEKATGHIYEVEMFSPRKGRISNTTMPEVYNAVWNSSISSLATQYLEDDDATINSYSITVKGTSTTTENAVTALELPSGINEMSVFGGSIFYLTQEDSSSSGYISSFDLKTRKQIWSSPIKEISSQYVNANTVALTTKPEENTEGFLYFVNTGNGNVRRILGNILGLSTKVSSDGTKILYLDQKTPVTLNLFDNTSKTKLVTSPTTFPEKCVWSKKEKNTVFCAVPKSSIESNSLSSWYKGQISTDDDLWKIDLTNEVSIIISELDKDAGIAIDVINPILSEGENYLLFTNKKDNTLWSLDLTK